MNVLHVIDHLGFGGTQTIVKGIFEKQPDNHNIFLFPLRTSRQMFDIQHPNVIPHAARERYSFAPLNLLRHVIQRHHIQVVHCHLFRSQIFGYLLKRFYFPDICLIWHEHGSIVGSDRRSRLKSAVYSFLYTQFMRIAVRKVDRVIAVSYAAQHELIARARIPMKKIVVLHNCVDLERFHPSRLTVCKKAQFGITDGEFVVGFAGRIIARKGWREYVEAAHLIADEAPNMKFLISGDGEERAELLALIARHDLQERVTFLGYVAEMLDFYSCLDCFVMPSYWEGLPLTQLEVMALGIPLITSDAPGLNEIPRKNLDALFVQIKNPQDVAAQLVRLYQDHALRGRLKQNATEQIQHYGHKDFLTAINTIYGQCLSDTLK